MRSALLFLTIAAVCAAQTKKYDPTSPDPEMKRPIAARDTVFIEELTWMEVRDAIKAGKTTAIIATGGVEMNGPYVATGKHNYVLRATTEAIARKLGNALVAPIVPFVPEGSIEPPTSHMRYPGSISVREETFRMLLTDIARSLKTGGFKHIILIGDSGGNVKGMHALALELTKQWRGVTIHHIPEYYNYAGAKKWLAENGVKEVDEGHHDDFAMESQIATVDPNLIRAAERGAAGKLSINGVNLAPMEKTVEMGKRLVNYRATVTVAAIKKALGQ